jgi:hypothetical protein
VDRQGQDHRPAHLHTFTRGLGLDRDAVNAALTHPFHNGGTEGVNTKTKLIKRQMYGRAGFALLRHRILLSGLLGDTDSDTLPPLASQHNRVHRPHHGQQQSQRE